MLYALNSSGNKVYIDKTIRNEKYFCPVCGSELVCKFGDVKIHHFAHQRNTICKDSWHYDMSEWHFEWQNLFEDKYQEVVKSNNGVKHRADILIEETKTVIEFQHSSLSYDEFEDRNNFYKELGYKIIWIFDCEEAYKKGDISNYSSNKWSWSRPRKTFDFLRKIDKTIEIYLQIDNDSIELIKVSWCTPNDGFKRFITDRYSYDEESILEKVLPKQKKNIRICDLKDKLIEIYRKDHTSYFFGCTLNPSNIAINSSIDIPTNKQITVKNCLECKYHVDNIYNNDVYCKKRFIDLSVDPNAIVTKIKKNEFNFIEEVYYKYNNEDKKIIVKVPENFYLKSILDLWDNTFQKAVFYNVVTKRYVRIIKNPKQQYSKYKKIYGYISADGYNYSNDTMTINNFLDNVWVKRWSK